MNYYGKVLGDHFNGNFFKEALLLVSEECPYRGAEIYKRGEYIYVSDIEGDVTSFSGNEKIYYQSQKIYECLFRGGIVI